MGGQDQDLVSSFIQALPARSPAPHGTPPLSRTDAPRSLQDKQGVTLPSFDDFRRRDEMEEGRDTAVPPELVRAARLSPEEQQRQTAQEKLLELLTFDTVGRRPSRKPSPNLDPDHSS